MDGSTIVQRMDQGTWINTKKSLNRRKYLFMNNYSGHKITDSTQQVLNDIITSVSFLPPKATH